MMNATETDVEGQAAARRERMAALGRASGVARRGGGRKKGGLAWKRRQLIKMGESAASDIARVQAIRLLAQLDGELSSSSADPVQPAKSLSEIARELQEAARVAHEAEREVG